LAGRQVLGEAARTVDLGRIGSDRLEAHPQRMGMPLEEAGTWLGTCLEA